MKNQDYTPYIIGGIALLLAFAICFSTAVWMLTKLLPPNSYIKTQAVIVDREPHEIWDYENNAYREVYYNLIEYEANGIKYQKLTETHKHLFTQDKVGETLSVYYNHDDPTEVLFKTPDKILITAACFVISFVTAVGAGGVFYKYIKKKKL
ncbi:MAG: hypothetical protein K2N33_05375 [Clostridia bacterium]|nr:hypothetical protein [Clostridia bacterium]